MCPLMVTESGPGTVRGRPREEVEWWRRTSRRVLLRLGFGHASV